MTQEDWQQVQELFHRALECDLQQRIRLLEGADPELRREVEAMLAWDERAAERLGDVLNPETEGAAAPDVDRAQSGDLIGVYQLVELIGEGGMGEVWLAEQRQPVRRRVALKLIKTGMNTREVMARFESERQALALMDHPAIAKVFDASSTTEGRPYFVMEYVPGVAITDYCDEHNFTVQQRLMLFVLVCEGVQHAHQKAIIHRDLKPSNILVAEIDGRPMPRIIDFGVAKATENALTAESMYTQVGAVIGTLGYMSPEQAELSQQGVDTRSDVYSLGVVLYELLVGALPIDFRKLPFAEALRQLREEDAAKPSTKLRTGGVEAARAAQNRGTDVATLVRQVRRDPDVITLKALEKDPARRYASPLELASDIGRYLRHEPVIAHAPSLVYQTGKYLRRHWVGATFAGVVALLLIAAAIAQTVQLQHIERERERADTEAAVSEAVNDFLQNDVLAQASAANQSSPSTKPDPHLEVRTALDRAAARMTGKFNRQPEVEAAIRDTVGQTYMDLGLYSEAERQLERALDLHRRVLGAENPKTLKAMSRIGGLALLQGKYHEAEALLAKTVRMQRRVLGDAHPDSLRSMNSLANAYEREGKYEQAAPLLAQTWQMRRRVLGPENRETLVSMNDLAVTYAELGKYAQAEALFSPLVVIYRRVLGPEHPDTLRSMDNLANTYAVEGKYGQAEEPYRQVTEAKRRILGPKHPETLRSMGNLAVDYDAEGKYRQAEALRSQVFENSQEALGREHPDTVIAMGNLADSYVNEGKYKQAATLFSQTLEIERRVVGAQHPNTLQTLSDVAAMYQREGKYALAEIYGLQALAGRRQALGSENPDSMASAADLALAYLSQGKFGASEPLAREALAFNLKNQPDNWQRFRAESLLGASLAGEKKYVEAEPLLLEGYREMLARKDLVGVPDWYHLNRAREWLVTLYQQGGKPYKAEQWKNK